MAEVKTCEQYVLNRLKDLEEANAELVNLAKRQKEVLDCFSRHMKPGESVTLGGFIHVDYITTQYDKDDYEIISNFYGLGE